jgi:hypothetical protein
MKILNTSDPWVLTELLRKGKGKSAHAYTYTHMHMHVNTCTPSALQTEPLTVTANQGSFIELP